VPLAQQVASHALQQLVVEAGQPVTQGQFGVNGGSWNSGGGGWNGNGSSSPMFIPNVCPPH